MKEVKIKDHVLQKAASEGMDEFVKVFVDAISEAVDGSLNSYNMAELNADQITLLAYHYLHEEVMSGGFVQLIHLLTVGKESAGCQQNHGRIDSPSHDHRE